MLGFRSPFDWCYQTIWFYSGAPKDSEDNTVMEEHGAEGWCSAVKSLMTAIWTEDKGVTQDAEHRMMQIAKP